MGNIVQQKSTASRILHILRTEEGLISGEELSRRLELSRTSIWKAVKQLQSQGIEVISQKRGYRFVPAKDAPLDLEKIPFQGEVIFLDESSTTMDESRDRDRFTDLLVIAQEQSQGQGRQEGRWQSPRGGLFCTFKKHCSLPQLWGGRIVPSFLSSLGQDIEELCQSKVEYLWPNRLLLADKKLGAVLLESSSRGDRIFSVSLGLGLYVNNSIESPSDIISLKEHSGYDWSLEEILSMASHRLEETLREIQEEFPSDRIYPGLVLGSAEMEHSLLGTIKGEVEGLDSLGNLLFRQDKNQRIISPGECLTIKKLT